ncbi:MAG TPA: RES domain-containing protein [Candidatus Nanopelagicales bacterium]|nr:RES domain-containing protein [Candidatus Nanopelagicales bacterium]
MSDPHAVSLTDGAHWLRVADRSWQDPLDPSYADRYGGRWNTPGDGPTLYLCADRAVARAQILRLLEPTPVDPGDLSPDAPYVLVTAVLPVRQRVADATTQTGLRSLGLPASYPRRPRGGKVAWRDCRRAARLARTAGLRGVLARSAVAAAEGGAELAWFPTRRAHARPVGEPVPFRVWWSEDEPAAAVPR